MFLFEPAKCGKKDTLQTLPVERGAGLEQPGIRAAEARLAAGDWVHIFPEGTRSKDGKIGSMRMGVGHLIASCSTPPLGKPLMKLKLHTPQFVSPMQSPGNFSMLIAEWLKADANFQCCTLNHFFWRRKLSLGFSHQEMRLSDICSSFGLSFYSMHQIL